MSSSSRSKAAGQAGFTLLEVLISTVILAFIGLMIYQTTVKTYDLRTKILAYSTFYNEVQLSMSIVNRDVALLYSPLVMMPPSAPGASGSGAGGASAAAAGHPGPQYDEEQFGRATDWWGAPTGQLGIRPSRFVGRENKFTMITASNIRVYKETPESEFAKVSYELKEDPNPEDPDIKGMMLVKTSTPNAFEEDDSRDKYRKTYSILHGVQKLVFTYYQKEKDKWHTAWDSNTSDLKNLYPDVIKVTLVVAGPSGLKWEGTYEMRPETPFRGLEPTL